MKRIMPREPSTKRRWAPKLARVGKNCIRDDGVPKKGVETEGQKNRNLL